MRSSLNGAFDSSNAPCARGAGDPPPARTAEQRSRMLGLAVGLGLLAAACGVLPEGDAVPQQKPGVTMVFKIGGQPQTGAGGSTGRLFLTTPSIDSFLVEVFPGLNQIGRAHV